MRRTARTDEETRAHGPGLFVPFLKQSALSLWLYLMAPAEMPLMKDF